MYKKIFGVFIFVAMLLAGCGGPPSVLGLVIGSGKIASESRQVTGFTGVVLEGSADVTVKYGSAEAVMVTADDNIVPLIQTVVENHQLIIRTKPNSTITIKNHARVDVTVTSLTAVSVSGSGNIDVSGINVDVLSIKLPGSGSINLSGTANSADFSLAGSGSIEGGQLKTKSATATVSGSGNMAVYANESLEATITGSGSIHYSGDPAQLKTEVRGSGKIYE